ncbi:MAG: hypothetical protein SVZ03_03815 [Spirochaetota bacterium]|nr:hypothetical protein [Spirochaetota bacterium]
MKTYVQLFLFIMILGLSGIITCSDDDSSTTPLIGSSDDGLSPYLDDVKSCTPDLGSSRVMEQWITSDGGDGWSTNATYGVLKKLFHPDSGNESVYGPVETVDNYIDWINNFSNYFDSPGTYTYENMSATIEEITEAVTIPYFGGTENNVDTQLTIIGTNNDLPISIRIAFGIDDNNEYIVCYGQHQYVSDEETQTGYTICHATRNDATGDISIELASIADKTDVFKIRYKFEGNTTENTFRLTQKTNAATGWCVLAGGSVAEDLSKIAVRATDNADSSTGANDGSNLDETEGYYVILTKEEIYDPSTLDTQGESGTTDDGWPKEATTSNLDAESDTEANYIDVRDTTNCLNWTDEYPSSPEDLAWE